MTDKTDKIAIARDGERREFKVEWWPVARPKPYYRNPRNNDEAVPVVAESLRRFGWQAPIVVDEEGVIIAGHTRLKAAISLGMEEVPVKVARGHSPAQVKALRLAHRQRLERLALATWSVNETDVAELRRLVRLGRVGRLDVFCGSLAERRTPQAWLGLKETCRATGGRAVLMRNHAKVVAFAGEAWSGAVEGSANLANNSGCEQIVLTRDARLADFYFGTFDGIKSMGSEV